MANIYYDLLFYLIEKVNKAIKTETQVLTDPQKVQARANIGALGEDYTPPTQTAEQVGADPKGTAANVVSAHNSDNAAHPYIQGLITELTNRLNALANSDDTTLDQLSEIVDFIKNNKTLIESVTTNKVDVSAIVDNLTTADAKKVLSANQGVELKKLIGANSAALANKPDLTAAEIATLTAAIQ
jgi:hypothetical protein